MRHPPLVCPGWLSHHPSMPPPSPIMVVLLSIALSPRHHIAIALLSSTPFVWMPGCCHPSPPQTTWWSRCHTPHRAAIPRKRRCGGTGWGELCLVCFSPCTLNTDSILFNNMNFEDAPMTSLTRWSGKEWDHHCRCWRHAQWGKWGRGQLGWKGRVITMAIMRTTARMTTTMHSNYINTTNCIICLFNCRNVIPHIII